MTNREWQESYVYDLYVYILKFGASVKKTFRCGDKYGIVLKYMDKSACDQQELVEYETDPFILK